MVFVIDASVTTCWLMPDETDARATAAYDRLEETDAVAPAIWWFETRNVLVVNERRGRIDRAAVDRACKLLGELPVVIDREPDETNLLRLALRHRLTIYDAAYLDLAIRRNAPLATLDDALSRAAELEGVASIAG